jgi:hypothetical protein
MQIYAWFTEASTRLCRKSQGATRPVGVMHLALRLGPNHRFLVKGMWRNTNRMPDSVFYSLFIVIDLFCSRNFTTAYSESPREDFRLKPSIRKSAKRCGLGERMMSEPEPQSAAFVGRDARRPGVVGWQGLCGGLLVNRNAAAHPWPCRSHQRVRVRLRQSVYG